MPPENYKLDNQKKKAPKYSELFHCNLKKLDKLTSFAQLLILKLCLFKRDKKNALEKIQSVFFGVVIKNK